VNPALFSLLSVLCIQLFGGRNVLLDLLGLSEVVFDEMLWRESSSCLVCLLPSGVRLVGLFQVEAARHRFESLNLEWLFWFHNYTPADS